MNCVLILNEKDIFSKIKIDKKEIEKNLVFSEMIILNEKDNLERIKYTINKYINNDSQLPTNLITKFYNGKIRINSYGLLSFVLIGDTCVGKQIFFDRFNDKKFVESLGGAHIGIDKEVKYYQIANDIYKVTLWLTAGQERFRILPKNIIKMLMVFWCCLMLIIECHVKISKFGLKI